MHESNATMKSFIAGGIIGATVAMLMAPRSGEETRAKLKHTLDETKEKVNDKSEQMKQAFRRKKDDVQEAADDIRKRAAEEMPE